MLRKLVFLVAAAFLFSIAAKSTRAETVNILDATLGESGQVTPDISTAEFRRILADRSALIIDARTRAEFVAGHVAGAQLLDMPPKERTKAVLDLTKGNKAAALVLYCNGPYCKASRLLANQLSAAGFTNVKRYQLGMPVWRALGGPTVIELDGIKRIAKADLTAVFIDARPAADFAKGSLPGAVNLPADEMAAGKIKKPPLPLDDFNRRVVLFGHDGSDARKLAEVLAKRPWHNVVYFPESFEAIAAALK
jgi:rhodanese-related sulfurtransferase